METTRGGTPQPGLDAGAAFGRLSEAIQATTNAAGGQGAPLSANQVLAALTLLRELRSQMAGWEPELIETARALGASWADLAPALGVGGRQSAERRYLRLRSAPDGGTGGTGDQRVAAERDRRAGDKAVALWARDNAAQLRQLAGQIGGLTDLGAGADADLDALRTALGRDDAADLLGPLAEAGSHLNGAHPGLSDRVKAVGRSTARVRADSDQRRRPPQSHG